MSQNENSVSGWQEVEQFDQTYLTVTVTVGKQLLGSPCFSLKTTSIMTGFISAHRQLCDVLLRTFKLLLPGIESLFEPTKQTIDRGQQSDTEMTNDVFKDIKDVVKDVKDVVKEVNNCLMDEQQRAKLDGTVTDLHKTIVITGNTLESLGREFGETMRMLRIFLASLIIICSIVAYGYLNSLSHNFSHMSVVPLANSALLVLSALGFKCFADQFFADSIFIVRFRLIYGMFKNPKCFSI